MPRYDVFLSHASADKPAVEHLAHKLREARLEPFLDKWHLIPGDPWQEALEEALDESRTCAVFLGKAIEPWQNKEMRAALETQVQNRSFRVIPVLLPGGRKPGEEKLPLFLRGLTWVDFRSAGLGDEDTFRRLLAGIQGKAPGPGGGGEALHSLLDRYRCMAPARKPFVGRSEYTRVRDALLAGSSGRTTTVGITTAIQGAGGFGKTALAIELCYDERVREKFTDGILWVQMRDNLNDDERLKEVRDVLRRWTNQEPPAFETIAKAGQHLIEFLNDKRVLLVVDDAWDFRDVSPFYGLAPKSALLVTTRDSRALPRETISIQVDSMEISEAVRLLQAGLPGGAEAALKNLAARLGEWPLLLKLVNRQMHEWVRKGLGLGEAIHRAENALKVKGLTYFDPKDAKDRSQASALTLEVSLEQLPKEDQERFAELAIFPEDVNVPLSVLEKLWRLDSFDVEELSSRLLALSLLQDFDIRAATIRLHDVIRAYLLKKGEGDLLKWNQRLLDAYCPANGRWSDLPQNESYLWNYLIYHLIRAGQSDICRALLLDFHYLRSKLRATGINPLLADYSLINPLLDNYPVLQGKGDELRLVRDALLLSKGVLTRNPAQLREQLWGRLLDRQETGIWKLLQASQGSGTHWLRPRKASLTKPGSALISTTVSGSSDGTLRVWDVERVQTLETLEGHSRWVRAMAVLDSVQVVSGSSDGALRVWEVTGGQILKVLHGQSNQIISAVAVLNSQRVISGSDDGTLQVWDVENGQILQVLAGHSKRVRALAVLDDRRVVSGSDDQTLRIWDVESGQTLQVLEGHSYWVSAVAALDSRRVVSGSYDQTLRVWDVENSQTLQILAGHSKRVRAVTVLDSRRVVSGSDDQTLRVWDLESGQTLQVLEGHFRLVSTAVLLDSHRVVSGSYDRMLRVWDLESRKVECLFTLDAPVTAVTVLPGSRVIVAGDISGRVHFFDLIEP